MPQPTPTQKPQRANLILLTVPLVVLVVVTVVVIALITPRELTEEQVNATQTQMAATAVNLLDSLFDQLDVTPTLNAHQMTATHIVGLNMTVEVFITQTEAAETPVPTQPAMVTAEATP